MHENRCKRIMENGQIPALVMVSIIFAIIGEYAVIPFAEKEKMPVIFGAFMALWIILSLAIFFADMIADYLSAWRSSRQAQPE